MASLDGLWRTRVLLPVASTLLAVAALACGGGGGPPSRAPPRAPARPRGAGGVPPHAEGGAAHPFTLRGIPRRPHGS